MNPVDWQPAGVGKLEPNASDALKHEGSICVIAGPGAGKTEFLAQRADYLFSTGLCSRPRRILAISYKRDAARNLAKRVIARSPDLSRRFDSFTFDAFTKGLVDRFRAALPELWRIKGDYKVWTPIPKDEIGAHLNCLQADNPQQRDEISMLSEKTFMTNVVGNYELPAAQPQEPTVPERASFTWWKRHFKDGNPPRADFVMLNRLAELIVRTNPPILRALLLTYPYVFIDEFQDTTHSQYAFLRSVFRESNAMLTVVGDNKQRIMGWAGALEDAFKEFQCDFKADRFEFKWNFRSSLKLTELQHAVAKGICTDAVLLTPKADSPVCDNPVMVWEFDSNRKEARYIARWIREDVDSSDRSPDHYALIARQEVDCFQRFLGPELKQVGLPLRNDSERFGHLFLQDLLADEFALRIFDLLRLAASWKGNGDAWVRVSSLINRLHDLSSEAETGFRAHRKLEKFIAEWRRWMLFNPPNVSSIGKTVDAFVDYLEIPAIQSNFPAQCQEAYLKKTVEAVKKRLEKVVNGLTNWDALCDQAEGRVALPLMTIHKSKGLEYHTVIFLGLEDNQWWSFKENSKEATQAFFVGLSRARQRTIFTYCKERGKRDDIKPLYELLDEAGVEYLRP